MQKKTTRVISDSHLPDEAAPRPRNERKYTLTPLGYQAVMWIKQLETKALDVRLPMDDLPHREIKKS